MTFQGIDEHVVDDKGRVALPARYRHLFADGVNLAIGAEGCVEVYTEAGFQDKVRLVTAEPSTSERGRRLRRIIFGRSSNIALDAQGRVLIPPYMREMAALNGAVVIAACDGYLEIWDSQRWPDILRQAADNHAQDLESLGERR